MVTQEAFYQRTLEDFYRMHLKGVRPIDACIRASTML
jgi:hypothetical protein